MSEEKQQQKTVDALFSFFFLTDGGFFFFFLFLFFFFFHFNSFCLVFPNPAAIVNETQIGTLYQVLNVVNLISILFRLLVNVLLHRIVRLLFCLCLQQQCSSNYSEFTDSRIFVRLKINGISMHTHIDSHQWN